MANIPDAMREGLQSHFGFTGDELDRFIADPRNAKVMQTVPQMVQSTIVFEVTESHGCNSQHVKGTRFYFSGDGNLLARMAPTKVCAYILPVMTQAIFGLQELWYAGVEPNTMCFKHGGCFDVGVRCGGWGRVIVEARVMDREEAKALYAADQAV